jgi:hypothetical protein
MRFTLGAVTSARCDQGCGSSKSLARAGLENLGGNLEYEEDGSRLGAVGGDLWTNME